MEHSPLGRLPPEIRNSIYKLAIVHHQPLSNHPKVSDTANETDTGALRHTCKQIRNETTGLFYAANQFVIKGKHNRSGLQVTRLKNDLTSPRTELHSNNITTRLSLVIDINSVASFHSHEPFSVLTTLELSPSLKSAFDYCLRFSFDRKLFPAGIHHDEGEFAFEVPVHGIRDTLLSIAEAIALRESKLPAIPSREVQDTRSALHYAEESMREQVKKTKVGEWNCHEDGCFS